jgi:hypothetical protein
MAQVALEKQTLEFKLQFYQKEQKRGQGERFNKYSLKTARKKTNK